MSISELRMGQDRVDIEADVTELSERRNFNKFGRDISVVTATLKDSSGTVKMSLWNQDIDKVNVGDRIKVTNGFVKEFGGEKQLTAGKLGKIEVIGKAEGVPISERVEEAKGSEETAPKEEKESEEPVKEVEEKLEESEELEEGEEF